jgi:small subunit ribosomal protein S4
VPPAQAAAGVEEERALARYHEAVCRQCRREGIKLFLKGSRCFTEKCAIERRNYPPGQHGLRRSKPTPYGIQLREKQKAKRIYGVLESQFRRYFAWAEAEKGVTGENLLKLLERRLDNVVFRLGMAASRREGRQIVAHGHIHVNGRKVSVPSYIVKVGEIVQLRATSKMQERVADNLAAGRSPVPPWLELDAPEKRGTVRGLPIREDIQIPVQEQLIVELFSK